MDQGKARPSLTVRMWPAYLKMAKRAAAEADVTLGVWLEIAIEAALPPAYRKELK